MFMTACQKVIDVDVRDAEKKYVIEAVVTDEADGSFVKISRTQNISETDPPPAITGANIRVKDDVGTVTIFQEVNPGNYKAPGFAGASGKTYELEINIQGELFTAQCKMPGKVSFDTLYVTDEILFGETRKLANIAFRDPPGKGQAYRYVQYINDKKSDAIFTNNDDYVDGKYIETKLWYFIDDEEDKEEEEITVGDTVLIEMQCIDSQIYRYWFSVFQSATGNSQSASPANPVSNIRGGALGYFSAHTVQRRSVKVE